MHYGRLRSIEAGAARSPPGSSPAARAEAGLLWRDRGGDYCPMLTYYPISDGAAAADRPGGTLWVDLLRPTAEEITRVETEFRTRVPPHEQIDESPSPLGFVISPGLLITVRYRDLRSFTQVREGIGKDEGATSSTAIFAKLLEALIDADADALERIAREL